MVMANFSSPNPIQTKMIEEKSRVLAKTAVFCADG
jgi:hypothetical protein